VVRSRFQLTGDIGGHLTVSEQRLRVAGGNEIELAVVVQLSDREKWSRSRSVPGRTQCERNLELWALRLGGSAPRQ
jgi:hypothetical protein